MARKTCNFTTNATVSEAMRSMAIFVLPTEVLFRFRTAVQMPTTAHARAWVAVMWASPSLHVEVAHDGSLDKAHDYGSDYLLHRGKTSHPEQLGHLLPKARIEV